MTERGLIAKRHWVGKIIFLASALVKLWLVSGQRLTAIGHFIHDDRLFLTHASALLSGDWLGSYDNLTLIKGPFYPVWIEMTFLSGLPLLLTQHLLYIAACAIFVIAIRPIFTRQSILLLIWAILLFNPMSYTNGVMTRVLREGIYPALTVLLAACSIGILARHNRPLKNLLPWSICLGFSLSAFWLTREEGIWMMPSILVIVGFAVVRMRQTQPNLWKLLSSLCILPLCIWLVIIGTVAEINKVRYGLFTTVELKSSNFVTAYGALSRVKHGHWRAYYPVPRETRERIYKVSAAFAELAPFLEGKVGAGWTAVSCHEASLCDDIGGGWFVWALRNAVAEAGYYSSANSAANYYKRLANEVNAACARGQIECGAERSSMLPQWHSEYIKSILSALIRGAAFLSRFEGFQARPSPSRGTEESLRLFRDLTGSRLSPADDDILPYQSSIDNLKISILNQIGRGYQTIVPFSIVLALISFVISTVNILRTKVVKNLWLISTALLIAISIRLLILSIIDVTFFPGINTRYLSPAYPLLLIFVTLVLSIRNEKRY